MKTIVALLIVAILATSAIAQVAGPQTAIKAPTLEEQKTALMDQRTQAVSEYNVRSEDIVKASDAKVTAAIKVVELNRRIAEVDAQIKARPVAAEAAKTPAKEAPKK